MQTYGARVLASPAFLYRRPAVGSAAERQSHMKITAYKSDISGELLADEKQLARIRVTFPNDRRKGARTIDATAQEADALLGSFGRTSSVPGRKPANGDAG